MNRAIIRRVLIAAVLALGVAGSAGAQQFEVGPRHELRASMGVMPAANSIIGGFSVGTDYYYHKYGSLLPSPDIYGGYYGWFDDAYEQGLHYDDLKYYDSRYVKMPSVGLSYTYRAKRWCEVGVAAAYTGTFNKRYSAFDGSQVGRGKEHFLVVLPTVRFVWMRRDLVRLYSTVSAGIVCSWLRTDYNYTSPLTVRSTIFGAEFIPLGISVGRRVFGFAEVGYSERGWLNIGVGIRLNSKNDDYEW